MTGGATPISPALPELVRRAALRFGTRTAVIDGARTLSFIDVERRSNALAHALVAIAPERAVRVAVLLPNQLEVIECDFAIAKAGMVRVPINSRLTQEERLYLIANSGAEIIIHASEYTDSVIAAREVNPEIRASIVVGGGAALSMDYEEIVSGGAPTPLGIALRPSDPSYMLYTSGTTGRPKGAVSTHGGRLASMITTLAQEQDIRAGDVMVHMASTAHGSGSKVLPFFVQGAANRLERSWDPELLLELAARGEATASFMVPTMVNALANAAQTRGLAPGSSGLRTIVYGGAPIPPAQLRRAIATIGEVFVQVYGSAEAPHPILLLDKADHAEGLRDEHVLSSAGRQTLLAAAQLRTAAGEVVDQPDVMGELWVRGPTVMAGYWNNAEATAEVMTDGWYRTGDVAKFDEHGRYYIVDRLRELIISGGYNVYPAEVEGVIAQHPAVRDVAVFGVPDEKWGEAVRAVVSPQAGSTLTAEMVVEHCSLHLAGYKKPRVVEVIPELPIGATGKVLRRELRAKFWDGRDRKV